MSCPSCKAAQADPLSAMFNSQCDECSARSLAHGPVYFAAAQAETMTPSYRDALRRVFGEKWKHGHERVKHWADLISSARKVVLL